jgi:hypothetical protein
MGELNYHFSSKNYAICRDLQMRKKLFFCVFSYLLILIQLDGVEELREEDKGVKISLGEHFQTDRLTWAICGLDSHSHIISKLDFRKCMSYVTSAKMTFCANNFKGIVSVLYGGLYRGKCQDSDYQGRNFRKEYSRTISSIKGKYVGEARMFFGPILPIGPKTVFEPSIGYAYMIQKFEISGGRQSKGSLYERREILGYKSLHAYFTARWKAPAISFFFSRRFFSSLSMDLRYTLYYPLRYEGHGYWNLRVNPGPHFYQKGRQLRSYGQQCNLALRYQCGPRLELQPTIDIFQYIAKGGYDQWKHFSKVPLKSVRRTGYTIGFAVNYVL